MAVRMTWLGQVGFVFEAEGDSTLVIDPYVVDHSYRRFPPPLSAAAIAGLPGLCLLITHAHLDHMDPEVLDALDPATSVVAPAGMAGEVRARTRANVIALPIGGQHRHGPWWITLVPAKHAMHGGEPYTTSDPDAPLFCGYLIRGPVTIWHAGDTLDCEELRDALRGQVIEVALVPINGRSHEREQQDIAGNTDAAEALALARHVHARRLVPTHWDMFEANLGDPAELIGMIDRGAGDPRVIIPPRGRPITL